VRTGTKAYVHTHSRARICKRLRSPGSDSEEHGTKHSGGFGLLPISAPDLDRTGSEISWHSGSKSGSLLFYQRLKDIPEKICLPQNFPGRIRIWPYSDP
jgi:hypothetical protein